jgi:hypothetical protein
MGGHGPCGNDLGYHTLIVPKVVAVPALSSSPVPAVPDESTRPPQEDVGHHDGGPPVPASLLSVLAHVSDPRKRRGVRHTVAAIVAVALAATIAGVPDRWQGSPSRQPTHPSQYWHDWECDADRPPRPPFAGCCHGCPPTPSTRPCMGRRCDRAQ